MIVKGAVACSRAKQLLPLLGATGTGRGVWAVSDQFCLRRAGRGPAGGCVPPPLHPSPFVAAGSKPLLGSLSRSGCVPLAGMHPRSRTAQPLRAGGLGSPVSERLGRVGWGPP